MFFIMLGSLLKIVGLMVISGLKFLFAPSAVTALGYTFWQTIFITSAGGCLGVVIFYSFGKWITDKITLYKIQRRIRKNQLEISKKWFTKKNRWIVKIKSKYGLFGIAFITPAFISIPIGSILAAKYCHRDARTLPILLLSVMFWSLLLTSISSLL